MGSSGPDRHHARDRSLESDPAEPSAELEAEPEAEEEQSSEQEPSGVQAHLVSIERLATLGTLAGSIGHELNNIVTVQRGAVAMIRRLAKQGALPPLAYLDELERVADHVSTHATHLLTLGRPAPEPLGPIDLRAVVLRSISMLAEAGKTTGIDVRELLPEEPVRVMASSTRIEQVLLNLIGNAADALEDVAGRLRTIDVQLAVVAATHRARCSVTDSGCGISKNKLERIFEPYFTTKGPARGTGLGLPVVRHIVEAYGGTVAVSTVEGEGTTFSFELPLA